MKISSNPINNKLFRFIPVILMILSLIFFLFFYILDGFYSNLTRISLISFLVLTVLNLILKRDVLIDYYKRNRNSLPLLKILQPLMVLVLMILAYSLTVDSDWKIDLTSSGLYTLSEETEMILDSLTNEMNIYYFKPDMLGGAKIEYQHELLKTYARRSPYIKLNQIDPYENRAKAVDFDVKEDAMVVFQYQGSRKYISINDLFQRDPATGETLYFGEVRFSDSIKSLLSGKPKIAYILTGHGEMDFQNRNYHGFYEMFSEIKHDNIQLRQLDLIKLPQFPVDCGLLIIGNPKKTMTPDELDKIKNYYNDGGNLLVFTEYETDFLINDILKNAGIFFEKSIVLDNENYIQQYGRTALIPNIKRNEITEPILRNRLPVITPTASALFQLSPKHLSDTNLYEYRITPLLTSSKYSYAETSAKQISEEKVKEDDKDIPGPVAVAYSGKKIRTDSGKESRIVIFGDTDFVNNVSFRQYGHRDLLLNSVNYLIRRESRITLRPKTSKLRGFSIDSSTRRLLTLFGFSVGLIYLIPGLIIILRRRSIVKLSK